MISIWQCFFFIVTAIPQFLSKPLISPNLENELMTKAGVPKNDLDQYKRLLEITEKVGYQTFFKIPRPENITLNVGLIEEDDIGQSNGEFNEGLFEGDILLSPTHIDTLLKRLENQLNSTENSEVEIADKGQEKNSKFRVAISSRVDLKWRMPIVYYVASNVDERVVRQAVELWEDNTCVTFQKTNNPYGDYISVFSGSGCYSSVGEVGGGQGLSLGEGCQQKGTAAHELGHALGLWHEQSRSDRDRNAYINAQNIRNGLLGNFVKMSFSELSYQDSIPYDFGSVMHYPPTVSINTKLRRDGIETTATATATEFTFRSYEKLGDETIFVQRKDYV